jgi:hypothetical protein
MTHKALRKIVIEDMRSDNPPSHRDLLLREDDEPQRFLIYSSRHSDRTSPQPSTDSHIVILALFNQDVRSSFEVSRTELRVHLFSRLILIQSAEAVTMHKKIGSLAAVRDSLRSISAKPFSRLHLRGEQADILDLAERSAAACSLSPRASNPTVLPRENYLSMHSPAHAALETDTIRRSVSLGTQLSSRLRSRKSSARIRQSEQLSTITEEAMCSGILLFYPVIRAT